MKIYKHEFDLLNNMITSLKKDDGNKELESVFNNVNATIYTKMLKYMNGNQFKPYGEGNLIKFLRIFNPKRDNRDDDVDDNYRISIESEEAIQHYCITNELIPETYVVEKKNKLESLYLNDFNSRINLKLEETVDDYDVDNILKKPKYFRLIERKSFITKDELFRFDFSCVRSNDKQTSRRGASTFTKSNLHSQPKKYEIEIEINKNSPAFADKNKLIKNLMKFISHYNFVSTEYRHHLREEQENTILNKYMKVTGIKSTRYAWIGPKPVTLEHRHLNEKSSPNILQGYGVTDKADGLRCLLFIDEINDVYAITMNKKIHPLKIKIEGDELKNSVLDTEYIFRTKNGIRIEKYAIFDIYVKNGENVMKLPFKTVDKSQDRYGLMKLFSVKNEKKTLTVSRKEFIFPAKPTKIWSAIRAELERLPTLEYHTDGIILQPMSLVVGGYMENNEVPRLTGKRWDAVFKWKPSEENTIDFLVKYNKKEITKELYPIENEVRSIMNCILHVGGFKEEICDMMYKDTTNPIKGAVPFQPTSPIIDDSYLMKLPLSSEKSIPKTELNEPIENYSVVECRYDLSRPLGFRWIPMRIRYDKTEAYRSSERERKAAAMNFIETAESIWKLTHQPVTEKMIKTGQDLISDDEIEAINIENERYFRNRPNHKVNKIHGLQKFHNEVIRKRSMIDKYANQGDYVLDLTCNKGQDIKKYIDNDVEFLFGIDANEGNIHNRYHGTCSQYIRYRNIHRKRIPLMAFLSTTADKPIEKIESYNKMIDKKAVESIFEGKSANDYKLLERMRDYGKDGFNIVQMMFSIQYYMKDKETIDKVFQNVTNHIRPGGIFMLCALNGKKVANLLKNKNMYTEYDENKEIVWQIERDFDNSTKNEVGGEEEGKDTEDDDDKTGGEIILNDDETSLGKKINVYIDLVKNPLPEYLVNFDYLDLYLNELGFVQEEMFDFKDIHRSSNNEERFKMTNYESRYSYLHTYAIYRKKME
jgi:hypothetical protein